MAECPIGKEYCRICSERLRAEAQELDFWGRHEFQAHPDGVGCHRCGNLYGHPVHQTEKK